MNTKNHSALWQTLAAFLRLSLVRFWQQALPTDSGLLNLLTDEASTLVTADKCDYGQLKELLEAQWPPKKTEPFAQFIQDLNLTLSDALIVTLLGEMERSHLIGLVIGQLQAPTQLTRPQIHLVAALIDSIFGDTNFQPLSLPHHTLIRNNIMHIQGDGPLPFKTMHSTPAFWAAMSLQNANEKNIWPECHTLPKRQHSLLPEAIQQQIPTISTLLKTHAAKGIVVRGHPNSGRKLLAQELAHRLKLTAIQIPLTLWQEHTEISTTCRYANWLPVLEPKLGPGETWRYHSQALEHPVIILLGTDGSVESSDFIEIVMPLPDQNQRLKIWQSLIESKSLSKQCAQSALLSGPTILTLVNNAKLIAKQEKRALNLKHVTTARQHLGSERLRLLAQPEVRQVNKDSIVLPPLVNSEMDRLIARAAQRETLWHGLGATLTQTFTAGVRALFIGESGTGKTLAASYLATQMGAPLYRVDLSAVMNKYIGESEKNLSAVLDMAAANDVVLLFDEADSLFGKRSEGKETGERFANMLTHFLLTRIENHPGIVILTSNNRERIDRAFTRRLDLIVEFPIPGFEERLALWRSHLGERGPNETIYRLLASYCDFTGGQLRNVVLSAATDADQGPITATHLLTGLQAEYRKLGRELPGKLQQLNQAPENKQNLSRETTA